MKKVLLACFVIGITSVSQIIDAQEQETPAAPSPSDIPSDVAADAIPQSVLQNTQDDPRVLEAPQFDEIAPSVLPQHDGLVVDEFAPLPGPLMIEPLVAIAPCARCHSTNCCCPVQADIVLVEPNCGCCHEICVTLPACCADMAPEVSWRNGILGRKIAMLCWSGCDKQVKVVIPRFGGPRVWEL